MNIVSNHSQSPHESPRPPDFIIELRRDWFQLACRMMQGLEDCLTPADALRSEIDAILKSFQSLKSHIRPEEN